MKSLRLQLLQKKLRREKIPALLITDAFNVRYLTGFTGSNGQMLVTPRKAFFLTDFRYLAMAKKILPKEILLKNCEKGLIKTLEILLAQTLSGSRITTLHFESKSLTYQQFSVFKKSLKKIKLIPASSVIENGRIIKSDEEVRLITKAQRIAEKVFLEVKKNLKPGKTESDIAWEIEKLGREYGADQVSFPSIVAFQEGSASPHHQPGSRKLKRGDVVLIDMGMQYQGYCSDMTRMIFTKEPTPEQKKVYHIVLKAQEESEKAIKANVKGQDIDRIARDIITGEGYGETFGHSLGHGIGLEVHENPGLSSSYEKFIPENTVVTIEPGIYLEKSFGIRIEDMVLVKRQKAVNLTKISKKIENCIHPL